MPLANLDHAVEEIRAVLSSYYNMAEKRFVDKACALVHDC